MKPPTSIIALFLASVWLLAGCGEEIGDSCVLNRDCSTTGERICARDLPGGYCTISGCDFDSCPDGSVCVRFFAVGDTGLSCSSVDDCGPDEFCTLGGQCVPRTAEIRYCMQTCGGDGDCRDQYECRDRQLMELHGGEPVPEPGQPLGPEPQSFCAGAPIEN